MNIGGQLQFRIPDKFGGGICECYWVAVDTHKSVPEDLTWDEQITKTATVALTEFTNLQKKFDFLKEGLAEFGVHLKKAEDLGGDLKDMMCFVWYVSSAKEVAK